MPTGLDISAELNVIATERYGSLVKKAVHDAIEKVNGGGEEKNDGPKKINFVSGDVPTFVFPEWAVLSSIELPLVQTPEQIEEFEPVT